MILLKKGVNVSLPFQVKNQSGGIVDLTSSTVVFNLKVSALATSNIFQKTSDDSDEIEVLDAENGLITVKILSTDTSVLTDRDFFSELITDSVSVINNIIRFSPFEGASSTYHRTSGTTAQRPTLGANDVGFEYYDSDLGYPIWWNGAEWIDVFITIE